jgi:hypothetical protein
MDADGCVGVSPSFGYSQLNSRGSRALRLRGFRFLREGFVDEHFEVGLILQAALFGLLAGEFDVDWVETDGCGGETTRTRLRAAFEAPFGEGLNEVLIEFFPVVEPPLGFFGFSFEFRNDSLSMLLGLLECEVSQQY